MVKQRKIKCKYRFTLPEEDQECIGDECVHYQHVLGKDPQTGEPVDHYMCSDLLANKLKMENTKVLIETGAAIESLRNETVEILDKAIENSVKFLPKT